MTRVNRFRLGYSVALFVLGTASYAAIKLAGVGYATVVAVLVMFLPGRVQGLLLRPLFQGRVALENGQAEDALVLFARFLSRLEAQPWRRWALWLSWSMYSPSAKAMALNNIGAAQAALGHVESAEQYWKLAIEEDKLFPVPYANLSAVAASRGQRSLAESLLGESARLGYSGGVLDKATVRAQELLARAESVGPSL